MQRIMIAALALALTLTGPLRAQDAATTVEVPLGLKIQVPIEALRGAKGDKGDPGIAQPSEEGDFTPVLGGQNGETDQIYSSQQGSYKVIGGICHVRVYIQFANAGTINGPLVLKNLPKPAARRFKVQIFGGTSTYFSNPRPDAPVLLVLRAGGGMSYAFVDGIVAGGQNPRSGANMLAEHVVNNLTQLVAAFDYFVD